MEVRIGTRFEYFGKTWTITRFSKNQVLFQSKDGLKSQLDLDMFVREAKVLPPAE